jgi:isopentenyl phosphate kinase
MPSYISGVDLQRVPQTGQLILHKERSSRISTNSNRGDLKENVVVIKFGGSAITDKRVFETLKERELLTSCLQIQTVYAEVEEGSAIIIVHGAGSFGHHQAKQYSLKTGGGDDWKTGLIETRRSVLKLNANVCNALSSAGVPVVTASPFSFFSSSADAKDIASSDRFIEHITSLLRAGFVPISHGDVVLDSSTRCGIMSGDRVIDM